jgi:hypothetical protein
MFGVLLLMLCSLACWMVSLTRVMAWTFVLWIPGNEPVGGTGS